MSNDDDATLAEVFHLNLYRLDQRAEQLLETLGVRRMSKSDIWELWDQLSDVQEVLMYMLDVIDGEQRRPHCRD